jgi:hypothetical protein
VVEVFAGINFNSPNADAFNAVFGFEVFAYGYVAVKDQPVLIDINSPTTCRVEGTAFDLTGQPLGAGVTLNANAIGTRHYDYFLYRGGDYWWYGSTHQAITDENGRFVFTDIPSGYFLLQSTGRIDGEGYFQYPIDNCRPVNGQPRVIRMDVPTWIVPNP